MEDQECYSSGSIDRELQKKQRNYQKMLKHLELLQMKQQQEQEECNNLRCALEKEQEIKQKLKKSLFDLRNEVSELQERKKCLCEKGKDEINDVNQQMAETVREYDNKVTELTQLTQQLEETQSQLRIETSNLKTLEERRNCLSRHGAKTENLLTTETEKLNSNKYLLNELEPKLQQKEDELSRLTGEVNETEKDKISIDEIVTDAGEKLCLLRQESKNLRSNKTKIQEELMALKLHSKCVQKDLDEKKSKLHQKRKEQKHLKNRMTERKCELQKRLESQIKCIVCDKSIASHCDE